MTDFQQEIKRLQKLSCIALSPEEEHKLWKQLNDIIGFLGQLKNIDIKSSETKNNLENPLRTLSWVKNTADTKKIMKNVKHEILNNSIVIKSVLS